ncbi:hypothetical protein [Paenibacillus dendritiformis]|uniref:hypothetical protein n=1 Tax=Paenibacillus dendritiformis TaxID=130049 RepID=UPI000DA856D7|nr:hypothetical protein [Paenibacillus dendritiformis]PZM65819.1 hypothetical protein DOE73_09895 [Paenibacillus dendritiformis]
MLTLPTIDGYYPMKEGPTSSITILCNEARYYDPNLADAILEVFKSLNIPNYRLAVKSTNYNDPLLEQRISDVVSLCEQEVQAEYDEFYSILKKLKEDPSQIYTYFYKLEDLFVQNIRVAEIGYILGLIGNIK